MKEIHLELVSDDGKTKKYNMAHPRKKWSEQFRSLPVFQRIKLLRTIKLVFLSSLTVTCALCSGLFALPLPFWILSTLCVSLLGVNSQDPPLSLDSAPPPPTKLLDKAPQEREKRLQMFMFGTSQMHSSQI